MELLILSFFCALVGLGCLGGAAWAVLGGEDVGVELIFLIHVWVLFGALFLGMAAWIARQGPLKNLGKRAESTDVKPPEPSAKTTS